MAAKLHFGFSLKMNNLLLGGCNLVTKMLCPQANHSCSSKNNKNKGVRKSASSKCLFLYTDNQSPK